ncbi:MAG TPA: bifunctional (p)ppGpp synthetase/guanosine-3',5'-bis(diphosphate) 3'-pyrophosphohydrolase, partial [Firmicutes bacterium]|nr:bifunctional (p)ppGpp synthetase/guanosine-3',5'-bis(diphosphate) 3'-pyrophosphohydrolase [Bacillota bacterium]
DVYAAVGYGGVSVYQIVSRLKEILGSGTVLDRPTAHPEFLSEIKQGGGKTGGVKIDGISNIMIRFAKCCSPVPGDDVVGFVTRGRGLSIHRRDCANLQAQYKEALALGKNERLLDVEWEDGEVHSYPVDIEILGSDRPGLLMDLVNVVSDKKVNITAVNSRMTKNNGIALHFTLAVKDVRHLENVINSLKKVKDIYSVRRYIQQ